MHKFIVAVLVFFVATPVWSASDLKDALTDLFVAAGEYIAVGYQLSYVDQTGCKRYPLKENTLNALDISKNDVGKMIHGSMFDDLLKTIEPIQSQLRQEVDVLIGSELTAFQCGKAKGVISKSFEQSNSNWLRAVSRFNRAKQDQGQ